jgi:hypothetical protein
MRSTDVTAGGSPDWRNQAACRNSEAELFFPISETSPACAEQVAQAKAICAGCPVVAQCLQFACATLSHGIAGGMTSQERYRTGQVAILPAGERVRACVGGTQPQVKAAGQAALRAGWSMAELVDEFGVTERTVQRWAQQLRAATQAG